MKIWALEKEEDAVHGYGSQYRFLGCFSTEKLAKEYVEKNEDPEHYIIYQIDVDYLILHECLEEEET